MEMAESSPAMTAPAKAMTILAEARHCGGHDEIGTDHEGVRGGQYVNSQDHRHQTPAGIKLNGV
jgi:hypothetical protein